MLGTLRASSSFIRYGDKNKSDTNSCRISDILQDECASDKSSTGKMNKFIPSTVFIKLKRDPPVQPSVTVAKETYLEEVKQQIAEVKKADPKPNLSRNNVER